MLRPDFTPGNVCSDVSPPKPVPPPAPPFIEPLRDQYLDKHPYLEEFVHSPSCEFLAIHVQRYILVERFQNVTEYRIENELDSTH